MTETSLSSWDDWPLLSVIVCAKNEGDTIEAALQSLLAEDYPRLELIVVNDRSSDGTAAVIDRLAAQHACLRALHLEELPPGWIGKVHAQFRGAQLATGSWLLFTDADIHYRRGCLRRALAHAQSVGTDHLLVLPRLIARGFWCGAFMYSFQLLILASMRLLDRGRLHPDHAMGIGAFNLVRHEVLARSHGLAWLKMEVIDDMGLGLLVRLAGGETHVIAGPDWLWVTWYPSLAALARGLEKNFYAALAAWRPLPALFKLALLAPLALAPFVALALGPLWMKLVVAGVLIGNLSLGVPIARKQGQSILVCLLFGPGILLIVALGLRAVLLAHWRKGINWRGTHYDLSELRAGQRFYFSMISGRRH